MNKLKENKNVKRFIARSICAYLLNTVGYDELDYFCIDSDDIYNNLICCYIDEDYMGYLYEPIMDSDLMIRCNYSIKDKALYLTEYNPCNTIILKMSKAKEMKKEDA